MDKAKTGDLYAIELKIKEATRGVFTQVLSYMADLEQRGERPEKVRGIIIAPSFAPKVLNAASSEPRVTLLQFRIAE